ncbi:LD-carboxypeptidase [Shimazuella sp. AN120528]|uniref:S66 peptidase family protein n=1 Tax=Shimazuella soli TaxID=1892854 RepID=UPI001F106CA2|nr:LD-carboxypeptidase [Shimazuella soli]MCH5584053.1 LD-carboxypeptidase [Shimazuella soli]
MIPKPLRKGAYIGIVAPSSSVDPDKTHQAIDYLYDTGYVPILGDAIFDQNGFLAGNDKDRLADLHRMFADPEIEAILCLRGGYGCLRIVDQLDFGLIRRNPKWLIGYSDITTLLNSIYQITGIPTIHGPMLAELPKSAGEDWWFDLWRLLRNPTGSYSYPKTKKAHCLFPGNAVGSMIGGNLSLLVASLGTAFEIDTAGRILFIEEVGENPYRIDRMLTQLRLAGKLQACSGIVFGDFTECHAPANKPSIPVREILTDHMQRVRKPAFYGLPAGHSLPNYPIPIGAEAFVDANACFCMVSLTN